MSDSLTLKLDVKKSKPSANKEYIQKHNKGGICNVNATPQPTATDTLPVINIQLLLIDDPDDNLLLKVLDDFDKETKENDTEIVSNTFNNVTNTTSVTHNFTTQAIITHVFSAQQRDHQLQLHGKVTFY